MRVGILQFAPKLKEKERNLYKIEEFISDVEVDGIVLPELSTTGYAFASKAELLPFAEPIPGPTTDRLGNLATHKKMWLAFGMAEREGEDIYNSCVFVSKIQELHKYRKLHLFKREKLIFTPGNLPLPVISVDDVKIGLLICFDWIFPEATRTLALKGAQIICHPSNLILHYCQSAMRTMAIENRVFMITAKALDKNVTEYNNLFKDRRKEFYTL